MACAACGFRRVPLEVGLVKCPLGGDVVAWRRDGGKGAVAVVGGAPLAANAATVLPPTAALQLLPHSLRAAPRSPGSTFWLCG